VQLDATYTTPDQSHAMMEPHATIAAWEGDKLTLWTSNQMVAWGVGDLAKTLGIPKENVRLVSPFIGGGFGGKLFLRADVLLAALGARAAGGRSRSRCAAADDQQHHAPAGDDPAHPHRRDQRRQDHRDRHESWSGDLPGGQPETAVKQTRLLYAGANRMTAMRLAGSTCPKATRCARPARRPA
jgi:xanthine dehydrogenase YagR molybdenum-binding subunit